MLSSKGFIKQNSNDKHKYRADSSDDTLKHAPRKPVNNLLEGNPE
jgi:hypothetical protein